MSRVESLRLDARHSPSGCAWTLSHDGCPVHHWEWVPAIPDFLAAVEAPDPAARVALIEWFDDAMARERSRSSCGLCWLDKRKPAPATALRGALRTIASTLRRM